jgi:hypothetical protein
MSSYVLNNDLLNVAITKDLVENPNEYIDSAIEYIVNKHEYLDEAGFDPVYLTKQLIEAYEQELKRNNND